MKTGRTKFCGRSSSSCSGRARWRAGCAASASSHAHEGGGRSRDARLVTLLQFNGDRAAGRWRSWSGEDRHDGGRCPWDQWATEALGDFAEGADLRRDVEILFSLKGGHF